MHDIQTMYVLDSSNDLLEDGAGLLLRDPYSERKYLDDCRVTFCI